MPTLLNLRTVRIEATIDAIDTDGTDCSEVALIFVVENEAQAHLMTDILADGVAAGSIKIGSLTMSPARIINDTRD